MRSGPPPRPSRGRARCSLKKTTPKEAKVCAHELEEELQRLTEELHFYKNQCEMHSFSGKSISIVGLGRIGSAIGRRAEAFGCFISYHSRSEKPHTNYKYYSDIINLAANSEILFVACTLTEEIRHIVNRAVINALGTKRVLINIGRCPHVDEPELVSALLKRS